MKNPLRLLLKASRLLRKKPISAALALQRLALASVPGPKRVKTAKAGAKRKSLAPTTRPARPAPGTFVDGMFRCPQGQLAYKLYTPQGSARRKLPLIVMLHGCAQSAADFAAGTGMNALADEQGFLVLYPQQSALANLNRCWNWHRHGDRKRGGGEVAMIAGLARHIIAACKANPARVYIAGLSAGAIAAAVAGAAYPDIFAAVGVHSGLVAGDTNSLRGALSAMRSGAAPAATGKAARPLPTILFQGDRDKVVHPSNAVSFVDVLRRSSPSPLIDLAQSGRSGGGREFTRTIYRLGKDMPLLEEWIVHGNGHAWSGGTSRGSFTDPAGPDASREMVKFFLARKKAARMARSVFSGGKTPR